MSETQRPNAWLATYAQRYWSQFGEEGIIEHMLTLLPTLNRWCVEFGAWDGMHLSNTCYFILRKEYSAVLIEADAKRFQVLKTNYQHNSRVQCLNRAVGFNAADGLDTILAETPVPTDFDILSIDIDGNDYHAWRAVSRYQPKIVVIEYNPTIPDPVEFVQPPDPQRMHGSSILSLCNLGRQKGYELVAATFCNLIFVDARYFPLFGIGNNSIAELRTDRNAVTYLFQGYDGTVLLSGPASLLWHDLPYHSLAFQVLPEVLRKYPDNYTAQERTFFQLYRKLYLRWRRQNPSGLRQLPSLGEPTRQVKPDAAELALWTALANAQTICLEHSQRDPRKRYASAEQLAGDLRSLLKGKPIMVRPGRVVGHAWRWCRRNPVVAGLAAATGIALLAGALIWIWFAIIANL